ncbi:MAG: hypothetical protein H6832_18550 [Planctomycetes bacterium]|nr:hypothetical protein [Planctomycetota bacterium]
MKTLAMIALGATCLVTGRLTYSAVQTQVFPGSALKVTPDPSNIWSFHDTVSPQNGKAVVPVIVDFDKNGKSDTELAGARLLVTDVELVVSLGQGILKLNDSTGTRWELHTALNQRAVDKSFASPLAIPFGSKLELEVLTDAPLVSVHVIGRLVTL